MPFSLSEAESKTLLGGVGIPFCRELLASSRDEVLEAGAQLGFPVVLKANARDIAHKSERGLVIVNIQDKDHLARSFDELLHRLDGNESSFIVAEMVRGGRELIVGLVRDDISGPFAMIGLGGVAAEAIRDVVLVPLPSSPDAITRAFQGLKSRVLFDTFRGESPMDLPVLVRIVEGLATLANSRPDVISVDINPLIVTAAGELIAVDALVEIEDQVTSTPSLIVTERKGLEAMFDPRGIVVLGASTHPGKFGFVALHNITVSGFRGAVYGFNQSGEQVLDASIVNSLSDIPVGSVDLAFFCTPASMNEELLRQCASRGITAAFVASAGYRESDVRGAELEERLVLVADELGIALGGPNGQGLVSTPSQLCAQIVAPYPPSGSLSVVSQSGNFVSSFLNWSVHSGVGVARAVSAGNSAQTSVADYLEYFTDDSHTDTSIVYLESISDGPRCFAAVERHCRVKPLVLIKGGRTESGKKAASSHTGAMASNYETFAAKCRSIGASVVDDPEMAFDIAAAFNTLPSTNGGRLAILTTVGGWGVVSSDVVHALEHLQLAQLTTDLLTQLDETMPTRWSRSNPLDCAGGETRDTVPQALEVLCASGEVDMVLLLGLGIQGNQAQMMKRGGLAHTAGLDRIIAYHERQEMRYVDAAVDLSGKFGVPVALATELAVADRENAAIRHARERSAYVFPSGPRAARALDQLVAYSLHRRLLP